MCSILDHMKSLLNFPLSKNIFTSIIAIFSIVGYGVLVFAQPFAPGTELDPACAPTDNTCVVTQAWEQNLVDGIVFNDSSNIAIGIDTTTKKFTVKDGMFELGLDSVSILPDYLRNDLGMGNVPGSMNIFSDTVNNNYAFNGVWDSSSFGGQPEVGLLFINPDMDVSFVLNSEGIFSSVNNGNLTYYVDGGSIVMGSDGGLILYRDMSLNNHQSNVYEVGFDNSFVLDQQNFNLLDDSNMVTFSNSLELTGGGSISKITGFENILRIGHNQDVSEIMLSNQMIDFEDDPLGITGVIPNVYGSKISLGSDRNIENFSGYHVNQILGSGVTENVSGFKSGALSGTNVFAFHVPSGSLTGTNSEYGLYIADGENYLSNGVRLTYDTDDSKLFVFDNGGSYELYFGNDIGAIATSTPSDERLKNSITNTSLSLNTLMNIDVVDFTYDQSIINDDNQLHHGVIAQDLNSIYPYAVTTQKDGYYVVDYTRLTPLIIQSIQELDLKLENIQSTSTTVVSSGFSLNSIRDWLGDVGNGIQKIFASLIEGNTIRAKDQLCVGDTCISESEFIQLLDSRSTDSNPFNESSGGGSGGDDEVDEEIVSDDQENENGIVDELPDDQEGGGIDDNPEDGQAGEDSVNPSEPNDGDEAMKENISESEAESEESSQQETESQVNTSLE